MTMSEKMQVELDVKGMTCDGCARHVSEALKSVDDVDEAVVEDWQSGTANVVTDSNFEEKKLLKAVKKAGYKASIHDINKSNGGSSVFNGNGKNKHLVIIGGGSAAFAATIQARELGARVTMINDGLPIGGTCVNVGCVPSKNLIRAAEALHRSNQELFAGIESRGNLNDFKKLIAQKTELVQTMRQEKYINVVADMEEFTRIEGRAKISSPTTVEVNGETLAADYILIATGARPSLPPVDGINDVEYLTNESAFELDQLPESLIVLGGRYIALETAQMFSRFGSKVTVLQRSERILPTENADITDGLIGYFQDEGIDIITCTTLKEVRQENDQIIVKASINGEYKTFKAERILVATGRQPNTNNMGIEEIGITRNAQGYVNVDDYLQTSVPNIYAAGDVLGENMFVYTAAYEGKLAMSNALSSEKTERDYTVLPWVVFTDPQVAGVGLDELQARNRGIDAEASVLPLTHVPRSLAAHDTRGFIKLIRDRQNNKLIGARILAPEGSELLMEVAVAIKFGITTEQLKDMFHPYLTLSEGIKLAAITFDKSVAELSCCAT
jgi:mercuric reductase